VTHSKYSSQTPFLGTTQVVSAAVAALTSIPSARVSGLAASATTDTTNAANISSWYASRWKTTSFYGYRYNFNREYDKLALLTLQLLQEVTSTQILPLMLMDESLQQTMVTLLVVVNSVSFSSTVTPVIGAFWFQTQHTTLVHINGKYHHSFPPTGTPFDGQLSILSFYPRWVPEVEQLRGMQLTFFWKPILLPLWNQLLVVLSGKELFKWNGHR